MGDLRDPGKKRITGDYGVLLSLEFYRHCFEKLNCGFPYYP